MGMRFSIRPEWGIKHRVEIGETRSTIRRKSLLAGTYQWTWTDGQLVSAEIPVATTRLPVLTVGDAKIAAECGPQRDCIVGPATGWVWTYGDLRLSHRAAY